MFFIMLIKGNAELLNVLGNEIRFRILLYLASGEKCVCKIFQKLKLPQNLISHHLRILRKSRLVFARKEGKWVYYALNGKKLTEIKQIFTTLLEAQKIKTSC